MNDYQNNLQRNYISKEKIFEYVTEEEIFEHVFGFEPIEFDYITSPFRQDKKPGCWFQYTPSGLRFVDFGFSYNIGGKRFHRIDCFDAIQLYYRLPNFYQTLAFIRDKIILKQERTRSNKERRIRVQKSVSKVQVFLLTRNFEIRDRDFYIPYGISKQNLIDDKVFPISRFKMLNTRSGDITVIVNDIGYAFTNFKSGHKKIYRPFQGKKFRFFSNCDATDIGGIERLPERGQQLVITKSYKDYRVLYNQGLTVIWLQSESVSIPTSILNNLCLRFEEIIIFFDNDEAGKVGAARLQIEINTDFIGKSRLVFIPEYSVKVTDPSDYYKDKGKNLLIKFLKNESIR